MIPRDEPALDESSGTFSVDNLNKLWTKLPSAPSIPLNLPLSDLQQHQCADVHSQGSSLTWPSQRSVEFFFHFTAQSFLKCFLWLWWNHRLLSFPSFIRPDFLKLLVNCLLSCSKCWSLVSVNAPLLWRDIMIMATFFNFYLFSFNFFLIYFLWFSHRASRSHSCPIP